MDPVFVVGSGRSGTTILDKSLGLSSSLASLPFEPALLASVDFKAGVFKLLQGSLSDNELQILKGYLGRRFSIKHPRMGDIGFSQWLSRAEYLTMIDTLLYSEGCVFKRTNQFLNNIFANYLAKESKTTWIDGTPVNGRLLPEIQKIFPTSKFVHIIRDGVEVADSLTRLNWAGGHFVSAAQFWASQVSITRGLGQAYCKDNYYEIMFSDLLDEPKEQLQQLSEFLGIDFSLDMTRLLSESRATQYKSPEDAKKRKYVDALLKIK